MSCTHKSFSKSSGNEENTSKIAGRVLVKGTDIFPNVLLKTKDSKIYRLKEPDGLVSEIMMLQGLTLLVSARKVDDSSPLENLIVTDYEILPDEGFDKSYIGFLEKEKKLAIRGSDKKITLEYEDNVLDFKEGTLLWVMGIETHDVLKLKKFGIISLSD